LLQRIRQCLYDDGYTIKGCSACCARARSRAQRRLPRRRRRRSPPRSPPIVRRRKAEPAGPTTTDELDLGIPPIPRARGQDRAAALSRRSDLRRVVEETLRELTDLRDLLRRR